MPCFVKNRAGNAYFETALSIMDLDKKDPIRILTDDINTSLFILKRACRAAGNAIDKIQYAVEMDRIDEGMELVNSRMDILENELLTLKYREEK